MAISTQRLIIILILLNFSIGAIIDLAYDTSASEISTNIDNKLDDYDNFTNRYITTIPEQTTDTGSFLDKTFGSLSMMGRGIIEITTMLAKGFMFSIPVGKCLDAFCDESYVMLSWYGLKMILMIINMILLIEIFLLWKGKVT